MLSRREKEDSAVRGTRFIHSNWTWLSPTFGLAFVVRICRIGLLASLSVFPQMEVLPDARWSTVWRRPLGHTTWPIDRCGGTQAEMKGRGVLGQVWSLATYASHVGVPTRENA